MARRGLGRGLEGLIPAEELPTEGLQLVSVEAIRPNPHQPRGPFDDQEVDDLAASIREHGVLQPLIVTRSLDGGYQLVAGERRWRAARLAGLETVPVLVKELAPQQMLELALVENIQRADLNPLEEALAYAHLVNDFGLSQTEVARRVGKSRVAVTNVMRLLQASEAVQQALLAGRLSEGHGRALLGLPLEEQDRALALVLEKDLTVRQTEALVQRWRRGPQRAEGRVAPQPPEERVLEERFQESLGTRVRLRPGRKGGRVIIYYYSDEEFQALYQRLTGEGL